MAEVTETQLPGVGVRFDFDTVDGARVGILLHRSGRREVLLYDDAADPDRCRTVLHLSGDDSRTLVELLGASQVSEVHHAVQHQVEGLAIEWVTVGAGSPAVGHTIGEGAYRTRTGASIVAVLRGETSHPAPEPEFEFRAGDVAVAVGTVEGLAKLAPLLGG